MGFWRKKARAVIMKAITEAKENGVRGRALRRAANQRYDEYRPAAEFAHPRSKYPYRVWLQELDAIMFRELNGCSQMMLGLEAGCPCEDNEAGGASNVDSVGLVTDITLASLNSKF